MTTPAAALSARIDEFTKRPPDWDGDDGTAPSQEAVADAKAFLNSLSERASSKAEVFSPGDGEICFQWRRGSAFLEVGFCGDGTLSWYATDGKGKLSNDVIFNRDDPLGSDVDLRELLT